MNGEIGYFYLCVMIVGDVVSFVCDFYEYYDKVGLIIDVCGNSGGNVDSIIFSMLL